LQFRVSQGPSGRAAAVHYCLAGNEPLAASEQRVRDIVEWGCLPIVQRRGPLDWLGGPLPTLHDWTEQLLIDFQRWGNRLAKQLPFSQYQRGFKARHAAGRDPLARTADACSIEPVVTGAISRSAQAQRESRWAIPQEPETADSAARCA
jgi:hypothetical protein